MAYFLFIDESGQDRRYSPCEVLAGVAVEDRDLWNFILAIHQAEKDIFGSRYTKGTRELKGKKLLKKKVFRHAAMLPELPEEERRERAKKCLIRGETAGKREMAALGQAKLAYVRSVFSICARFRCYFFASIVTYQSPRNNTGDYLRKDYSYLFERFYYFLEDKSPESTGIIVFDELDKSRSHILAGQMDRYFKRTEKGQQRSGIIIPEPFFVHSELTTGVQVADLVAYVTSWGFRTKDMELPARQELNDFVDAIRQRRYIATREVNGNPDFKIWSFAIIKDLG